MLLLGAGASVEAGVPDSYEMTKRIAEAFERNIALRRYSHVISFAVGGLLFQQGIKGENPLFGRVNIEELFNAVQLLAERNSLEAAPFVGSWHAMVEQLDKTRSVGPQLGRLYQMIYDGVTREILDAFQSGALPFGERDIDRELEQAMVRRLQDARRGYGSSHSSINVGKKVGDYVSRITKSWMERLK